MRSYAVLAATFAGAALAQDMPMPSGDCAVSVPAAIDYTGHC